MISINMSATQWLASACRDTVRLADGPAKLRQQKSALSREPFYAHARPGVPVFRAGAEVPTQQITKGGLCGPQPWRDAPVIT